ncbi:amino acid permease-associated region [Desulfofundulus kuznetsovii DSM 6115]|uniref:Amino acid permease-associated region n=1 Tax=Desulfofundulus kuznetsovii (strain DSM 6115 / VKM B-1805 / 17) TaxID=760568 RepID=A0AAU8PKY6_DESK7|nr:amino acid permease-associated region [Desulfofundulus kuznetsovii DSM 6115]
MGLKRVLTLRTVIATSAGLTLASSSFVAAVQVAGFLAGDTAWLAILTGGLLCLGAASCFSELNARLPSAAGIRLYFSRAFNDRLALTVSLLYMAVVMGVVGAESYVLASVLNAALPAIPPLVWIVAMFLVVTGMNIRGVKIAGTFQDLITYGLMGSLLVLAFIALGRVGFQLTAPLAPGGALAFINAVAVGVFLFVGFEWVTPLAEEVTHSRLVSRGMLLAVGLLSVVYALFTVAMSASCSREALVASPAPQMVFARTVLGPAGVFWMVVLSLAASITTFNAGLISVSRFIYASAREYVLPPVFSRLSMRFFTPWVAILTVFAAGVTISLVVLATHRYLVLVNLAAAMESVVYALAGLAVIRLRQKEPQAECPYRVKGGVFVPVITALVFAGLAVAVMFTDFYVSLYLLAGFAILWWYVHRVVPALKSKYQPRRPARRRRPVAEPADAGCKKT